MVTIITVIIAAIIVVASSFLKIEIDKGFFHKIVSNSIQLDVNDLFKKKFVFFSIRGFLNGH